jgi:hypothetical protein
MREWVAAFGITIALLPIVVYFCVKLGTYAFLRARYLFEQNHPKRRETHDGTFSEETGREESVG